MTTTTLWVIRLALIVQFVGVLAVPSLVAAADAPRALWLAEWINPGQGLALSEGRTIGVLKVIDGKLSFIEQIGQVDWEIDLASVKRVAAINGGKALSISSVTGEEFIVSIMEANLTQTSPKKAIALIERAVQSMASNNR